MGKFGKIIFLGRQRLDYDPGIADLYQYCLPEPLNRPYAHLELLAIKKVIIYYLDTMTGAR